MLPNKEDCIKRLDVFMDSKECSNALREMAGNDECDYWLIECADHIDGLFEAARHLRSHLIIEGEKS